MPTRNRRKPKKVNAPVIRVYGDAKALDCKQCGKLVENCNPDTKAVTCFRCVAQLIEPPPAKKPVQEETRPRGWHFMKRFVSESGQVYHRGREVNESDSKHARADGTAKRKSAKKSNQRRKKGGKRTKHNR